MNIKNPSPKERAIGATLMFAAFGLIGVFLSRGNIAIAWAPILFYTMLVWNDYYSIKHFSKIIPPNKTSQMIIDWALVVLHFAAALFFGNTLLFAVSVTILFILAVLKYAGDLPSVKNSRALFRKVKIDALGALISALALAGMFLGYPWQTTVIWTFIFACSSVYVILINPLYQDTLGTS
jgi:hypothetical protein